MTGGSSHLYQPSFTDTEPILITVYCFPSPPLRDTGIKAGLHNLLYGTDTRALSVGWQSTACHRSNLWFFSLSIFNSHWCLKSEKVPFLHTFNFTFLVILGQICMILKFIFQSAVANFEVKFKHNQVHRFSAVLFAQARAGSGKSLEIFLGPHQYRLSVSFLLMANMNSHRSQCSWYNLIKMKLISIFIKT